MALLGSFKSVRGSAHWWALAMLTLSLPVSGPGRPLWIEPVMPSLARTISILPPVEGPIGSPFGYRRTDRYHWENHQGLDIRSPWGTPVHATNGGTVVQAGETSGYGLNVVVAHPDGITTLYAHLSLIRVQPGQFVRAGQVLGLVGDTGHATGPHLHFEIRWRGQVLDPEPILASSQLRTVSLRIPAR
jgi:murein DD-endopeptidase MepM/ murein hydrolase activator NlpD